MAILNLTHDDNGNALQRLPVGIKVAIGEPPAANDPKGHPKRLDHFVFKRRTQVDQDVAWQSADDIGKVYGENPREIGIIFMDDEIENVLRTNLAWWSQTECKCSGELVHVENGRFEMRAIRKTQRCPEGEPWPGPYKYSEGDKKGKPVEPCGDGCPDLEASRCKPNGALYFNLDKFPMVGAIASIRTTSYRSIRNLSNGLMQIRKITGGRLAGIRVMLRAEPEKIAYDGGDGKKHTSIAHILSLRIDATDMKVLLENMTETAKLFAQTKLLGAGRQVQYLVDDPEKERAPEMSAEFYPDKAVEEHAEEQSSNGSGKGSMAPVRADIPSEEEMPLRSRIHALCQKLNMNNAGELSLVGQYKGRLPELIAKLEKQVADLSAEAKGKTAATVKNEPASENSGPAKKPQPPTQQNSQPGLDF